MFQQHGLHRKFFSYSASSNRSSKSGIKKFSVFFPHMEEIMLNEIILLDGKESESGLS